MSQILNNQIVDNQNHLQNQQKIILSIDDREPIQIYHNLVFFTTTVKDYFKFTIQKPSRIEVADIVCGNLGFERKSLRDVLASIYDKRFNLQLLNMSKTFEINYVLISDEENLMYSLSETQHKQIFSKIADIEMRYNFRVRILPNDSILCYHLLKICLDHSKHLKPEFHAERYIPTTQDELISILTGFDFVGEKLAVSLLTQFQSIRAIANASIDELKECEKIGEKKAASIYNAFNRSYVPRM